MSKLINRNISGFGLELLGHFPAVVIQGARQVGKSTLAAMMVANKTTRLITLDDSDQRAAVQADPRAFVNQLPEGTLVIDEVQRLPELLLAIKASIDTDRRAGRFLLTGSADLLKVKGHSESLAGRAVTLRLRGLSLGEIADTREDWVAVVLRGENPLGFKSKMVRKDYVDAIARGSFPDVQGLPARMRQTWLDSYIERVLEHDATILPSGNDAARLRNVLSLIAANQAGELNFARIAEQAKLPANSVSNYVDVLKAVYLIDVLRPWGSNLTKREVSRPKVMVADSALALRLTKISPEQLLPLDAGALGGFLEAYAVGEFLKQQGWSEQEYELFHYRDRNGLEVDLIAELSDGRVIAVEFKASSTFKGEHFSGLLALKDKLGDRFVAGFVLSTATESMQFAQNVWGMPISALWQWGHRD